MTTRATLGRSIGVDASRPPCVVTCVERATTTTATSGEDVGFVKIRAVDDGDGDADGERATTSEREGEDAGTFGAAAFALDLRGWTFKARTQAVRALGAIGRMSAGTLKVEFRDEHEQHRARTEARGGEAGAPAGASWRLHGAGGWMFDLKSLAEETRKRVKRGKIEGNQTWREIAVALGAPHGRSGACGYAARRLWERWLEAFERERDEIDVASRAAEYAQAEETLGKDDLEVIHALVALEFRASGDPPARAVAENVRNFNPTRPYLITQLRSRRPTLLLEPYPKSLDEIAHHLTPGAESDANCAVCGAPGNEDAMILCDGCDRGSHMYCLTPKMTEVPSGEWYCEECRSIDAEIERMTLDEGTTFTLGEFNDACIEFDTAFFGEEAKKTGIAMDVIEECFWRMVEDSSSVDDVCEVKCGWNIDTRVHGSGFPRRGEQLAVKIESMDTEAVQKWAESAWNLNNVARSGGSKPSVLSALNEDIAGITTPLLEVGSTFSSTPWRREEHDLYSISYNHWGAAKMWYCVPASAAEKLEECFAKVMPTVFENNMQAMGRILTMLSPSFLMSAGVPVQTLEQFPGEYIITFPGCYYATFNCGMNCTERVNFAPADWLSFGSSCVERNRLLGKRSMFSHERLLCNIAEDPKPSVALELWPEIMRLYAEETNARNELFAGGVSHSSRVEEDVTAGSSAYQADDASTDVCVACSHILHLSGVSCSCDPSRKACLRHAGDLCKCEMEKKTMFYRYTLADLEGLAKKTEKAIPQKELSKLKSKHGDLGQVVQNKNRIKKAQAWVKRVNDELVKPPLPTLDSLKKLSVGAEEFVWAGADMKIAREAHQRVANAISWQTSLAALKQRISSGSSAEPVHDDGKETRLNLSRLEELLNDPPVPMPKSETQPFRDVLSAGMKLEERIQVALAEKPNPAPRACSSLQTEANRFSVEVPSLRKLKDVISRAGAWSTKVRGALPGRRQLPSREELANAKEIESLYEESNGLPVQQSELLTLRKALEEINFWRAKAESLFVAKVDIEEAETLLKEGLALSTKLDEVDDLAEQIQRVKTWSERARASDYPQARQMDLEMLLKEGESFNVRVEEVDWLKNRIVVRELASKLRDMISAKKHNLTEIEDAVKRGNEFLDSDDKEVAPDEEALLTQCEAHIEAAKKWHSRAAELLKMLGSKDMPTLDDAQSLIREGNTIPIILDGFDVLSEAVNTTKTWLDNAQPCLKGKQLTRRGVSNPIPPLSEAQNLLKTSKDLKLFIKEVELLEERVEAAEEWDVDAKDAIKRWREDGAEVTLGELELSHEDFGLELPAMAMVRTRINSLKWEERVRKIIAPKAKLVEDTVLDELRAEADELKDLDEELLAEIVKRHTLVDEWRKKADLLLDPPPLEDGRLAPSASPDEIDALIAEGKALPADVSKVEDLEASLADHAVWVEAVRKCLNSVAEGRPRPPMDELYELLAEVEDLTFKCSERQALTNACTAATAWTEKLNSLLWGAEKDNAKPEKTISEMLTCVLDSIKSGIEDITGNGEPPETEEGQFCLCRQAGGIQMVGCDDCGDWYHLKCINVSPTMAKTMHNYICPPCVAKNGKASALSLETYRSVHRTSRPNVMSLRELLGEAQRFPGEVPEEAVLTQLINTHDAWRLEVRKALHRKSMKEAHENAIKQAAKIAQEAATREADERTRRVAEAALTATAENPNPPASLTPLQQVMLMGQAVTFAATQRTHALSMSPCSPEISEVVTKQLNQLQQLAMQLAMCQAQIHMAPVRSRPHILHVLMMQQQHLKMIKEHDEELAEIGASEWLMNATLQLSGILPPTGQDAGDNQDAGDKAKDESVPAEVKAEQPMMPPQMVPQFGADVIPGMKQDMGLGIPMDITGSDVDPAVQVYAGMKGALAMELEPVEETLALMREVCAPSWRDQATELMTGTPFPKLVKLHELKESAMAAGLCPGAGIDPLADRVHALEVAGQIWLERAAAVVQDKTIPIEAAQMLLQEGRSLPLYLKDELEELGERCELYCVCRSAYDALRPMICCDRCDGWFHYECIGMQPPAPGEEDEDGENVKFSCPECCAAQGIPYVPFRPAPKTSEPTDAAPQANSEQKPEAVLAAPPQQVTESANEKSKKRKEPSPPKTNTTRSRRRK